MNEPIHNSGKPWTPEEDSYLKVMFENNESLQTIRIKLARTKGGVLSRLERHKLLTNCAGYYYRPKDVWFNDTDTAPPT
jgi:hypothetical protein